MPFHCLSVTCWPRAPPGVTRGVAGEPVAWPHRAWHGRLEFPCMVDTWPLWFPEPGAPPSPVLSVALCRLSTSPMPPATAILGDRSPEARPLPAPLPGGSEQRIPAWPPACGPDSAPSTSPFPGAPPPPLFYFEPCRLLQGHLCRPPIGLCPCSPLPWGVLSLPLHEEHWSST